MKDVFRVQCLQYFLDVTHLLYRCYARLLCFKNIVQMFNNSVKNANVMYEFAFMNHILLFYVLANLSNIYLSLCSD